MTDYDAIVCGFIHTLWKTDGAELSTYLTDDYHSHESPDAQPGPKGELEVVGAWKAAFPDFDYEILEIVGDGDRAGVVGRISGTQAQDYEGIPATKRSFSVKTFDLLTLREGRICEHRGLYEDTILKSQLRG
jgi:predicted ester cyclase